MRSRCDLACALHLAPAARPIVGNDLFEHGGEGGRVVAGLLRRCGRNATTSPRPVRRQRRRHVDTPILTHHAQHTTRRFDGSDRMGGHRFRGVLPVSPVSSGGCHGATAAAGLATGARHPRLVGPDRGSSSSSICLLLGGRPPPATGERSRREGGELELPTLPDRPAYY